MRIFSGFTMLIYTLVFLAIGCALIAFSLNMILIEDIIPAIEYAFDTLNIRLIVGLVGVLIILYNLVAVQISLGNMQREKTIAFDNPSGRVTISLSAIEDFIRRSSSHIPEVKELRADVKASKKGINITNRVVVYSNTNIPEATERIQSILKHRIQEMLGIEEPINIKVHIAKIAPRDSKDKAPKKVEEIEQKRGIFKGIEYGDG
ncbi:MAG: alkaline shock response membrane anchor protein AmaP [Candidatus Omnitrophica bacterium]|nr:alkaline shock response membrane anchor protein AmaP [Candidatus Omnitrophota bacterium]